VIIYQPNINQNRLIDTRSNRFTTGGNPHVETTAHPDLRSARFLENLLARLRGCIQKGPLPGIISVLFDKYL
jgi:hypothetical protein